MLPNLFAAPGNKKENAHDEFKIHRKKKPKDTCKTHYIRGWGDGNACLLALDNNKKVNIDGARFPAENNTSLDPTFK